MSKELLQNTKFQSSIIKIYKKYEDKILDIVLFGSSVKGKDTPKDIDLLIIYANKIDFDVSYEFQKGLKDYKVSITDITYKQLFERSFKIKEVYLSEGYSILNKKSISEGLGYLNLQLFRYELKKLNKSERMRFYYSLYGRTDDQEGMIKKLEAIKFSDSIILCPIINVEKMRAYLNQWSLGFIDFQILMPERIKTIL